MSRPRKAVVDYFPHDVTHGRTVYTIDSKYGNDGYSFWYKMLELLGSAEHHFLDCSNTETWEFLLAKTKVDESTANSILETCARLGAINQVLWHNRIIRSDEFTESLDVLYKRREVSVYSNEKVLSICKHKSHSLGISSNSNPQSIVKDNIVDDSKQEETKAKERIGKGNPRSKSIPGEKKKNPEKGIQKGSSGIFQEAEEGSLNHIICSRAGESQILLEDELTMSELTGLAPEQVTKELDAEQEQKLLINPLVGNSDNGKQDHSPDTQKKGLIINKDLILKSFKEDW